MLLQAGGIVARQQRRRRGNQDIGVGLLLDSPRRRPPESATTAFHARHIAIGDQRQRGACSEPVRWMPGSTARCSRTAITSSPGIIQRPWNANAPRVIFQILAVGRIAPSCERTVPETFSG